MAYTSVFGGTTIYPSDVSYLPLALSADTPLEWPLESSGAEDPAARIIDVTPSASGYSVILPDATLTGAGQTVLFNNLSGSFDFFVKDYAGNTIATVTFGTQWQVYLAATTTAAGTWRVFRYGASTATVQPSALAGYGVTVTGSTLSQSTPVTTFNSSPRTVLTSDRAQMLVWVGTGAGSLNLPSAATAGNNFLVSIRNSGGGDLTVDPAGSETIDGSATLALRPGDSASLTTDGLTWYSLGFGQDAVFAFDYTSISVTGGNYTLSGSDLNRIAYKFVGVLASDQYVIVPSTIQQYWVDNATTGPFALYLRTSGGTPVQVPQGGRGIYYCNGTNVVDADTSTISLPVNPADGGTGVTSYSVGDLLYASGPTTLAKLSDVAVGNALISGGVGVIPSWGKIALTTHVSGTLPVANGGTGVATSTGTGSVVLSTSPTLVTPTLGAASATSVAAALGAVGTPSYTFTGDLNTGVWSPGADTIAASTGGSERLRVSSTGNVSIGNTNNVHKLDVNGSAAVRGDLNVTTIGTADGTINFDSTNFYNFLNFKNAGTSFGGLTGYWTGFVGVGDLYHSFSNHVFRSSASVEYGRFDSNGNFLITGAGGLGYGTGAGGAVTQTTSRTTGVTLNKTTGAITLVSAAGTTTWQSFTVTNSTVAATDVVVVSQKSGVDIYQYCVTNVAAGSFQLSFRTVIGTTTEQPVFNFAVIKGATS